MAAWQRPVQSLKGVGSTRAQALARLGIHTAADLLNHFPREHDDRSTLVPIAFLLPGHQQTFQGQIMDVRSSRPKRGMHLTKAVVGDGTGTVHAVWWNQPYRQQSLPIGKQVVMTGKVSKRGHQLQVDVPELEALGAPEHLSNRRIVPVYPLTTGVGQGIMRRAVYEALRCVKRVEDYLPSAIRERHGLVELHEAYQNIHFPSDMVSCEKARQRLAFDELYLMQVALQMARQAYTRRQTGIAHSPHGKTVNALLGALPFRLTQAQQRVIDECWTDMEDTRPMNRLIQGDVGSGKTVVAALAMGKAMDSGYQASLMVPTEILAEQHHENLRPLFTHAGICARLLTGHTGKKERQAIQSGLQSGEVDVLIGTHAVIQETVAFRALSLVVTDEQHRFGVRQRASLVEKGVCPDVLVMTATPIPRTLALTVYGDLDVSMIDQLPPGRKPVRTFWRTEERRPLVYKFVRDQVKQGRQAYVVCPLIFESEHLEVEAATELAEKLKAGPLHDLSVGLLHGKLPSSDKEHMMRRFREGEVQVLVSTTVVEVGVDVANATVIVIEGADRFGLSQLHQLRGRVARSKYQAYCILIAQPKTAQANERLKAMETISDGFLLAEEDLRLRGPGELLGTRQHGLPPFKLVDFSKDVNLMQATRDEATRLLREDPQLNAPGHQHLNTRIMEVYGTSLGLLSLG